jgi:uncharacterized protein with PIN domain
MICPGCRGDLCRRSRRRGGRDLLMTLFALRPWRCPSCKKRFYAWLVPVTYAWMAHCPRCGNFDLQRIARARVDEGRLRWLERALGFPAYRCDPCRKRFFTVRRFAHILPAATPRPSETVSP